MPQLAEMPVDRIPVDLKGLGHPDDIAVINHEPIQYIMVLQVLGEEAFVPEAVKGRKTLEEFFDEWTR